MESAHGQEFRSSMRCCRCEDDLTHKLAEIIKANSRLKKQEENGAPQHIIREFTALLQFHVTTYFDNTRPGMPVANQRGGRPIKSISQRLKVCKKPLWGVLSRNNGPGRWAMATAGAVLQARGMMCILTCM